jgi:hypothetical protein
LTGIDSLARLGYSSAIRIAEIEEDIVQNGEQEKAGLIGCINRGLLLESECPLIDFL